MLLAGDEPIIIELFYGLQGVFMGLIMGSQNIMGSDYGSNISDELRKFVRATPMAKYTSSYSKLRTFLETALMVLAAHILIRLPPSDLFHCNFFNLSRAYFFIQSSYNSITYFFLFFYLDERKKVLGKIEK
jgi:hypothetical protein